MHVSKSEVIRDNLGVPIARHRVVDRWLRDKVAPAYDALKADTSRAASADQIRARLAAEHQNAKGSR